MGKDKAKAGERSPAFDNASGYLWYSLWDW